MKIKDIISSELSYFTWIKNRWWKVWFRPILKNFIYDISDLFINLCNLFLFPFRILLQLLHLVLEALFRLIFYKRIKKLRIELKNKEIKNE
jgi:hypothetical protein